MSNAVVVTARISHDVSAKLDALARETERTRAWLIAKAIEQYVDEELEMIAFIAEGDADLREGRVVSHEDMKAWVDSLARPAAAAA